MNPRSATLVAILLAACSATSVTPPSRQPTSPCVVDPNLAGVWEDERMVQLAPTRVRYRFACDCTYTSEVRSLGKVTTASGFWRAEAGRLELYRPNGKASWVYRVTERGEELILEEVPGTQFLFDRKAPSDCS